MKKEKVLLVACNDLGIGGVQTVIMSIVASLSNRFQFDIIVFSEGPDYYDSDFMKYGGKIFRIPNKTDTDSISCKTDFYLRQFKRFFKAIEIMKDNGPYRVVHCNNYFEAGVFLLAAKLEHIPVRIAHSHNYFPQLKGHYLYQVYNYIFSHIIRRCATKRIACSNKAGEYLFGQDNDFHVIYNQVDTKRFFFGNNCTNPWSLVSVGRWGSQKNQVFQVRILNALVEKHPQAMLTIVGYGDDSDKQEIVDAIHQCRLEQHVSFLPGDTDICHVLQEHNVFLLTSTFEGFGIALIEAQATGMMCFASDCVPMETNCGLVQYLPLLSGEEYWANKISSFVEENGISRKEVDISKFDEKVIAEQYQNIYLGG